MRPLPWTVIQPLAPGSCSVHFAPGCKRQLLGAEQLLAVDGAVDDPQIVVAITAAFVVANRFQVVVVLEVRYRRSSPNRAGR